MTINFAFDTTYTTLPERFYTPIAPMPVAAPALIKLNTALAETLGLDAAALASPEGIEVLAGNATPAGAAAIALVYAGHQFGGFSPRLGDGRALLLGEVVGRDGIRRDIQLKGSGRTPYSRGGDGRAALGPVLREYLISEAMAALGVPTTRALAAVTTGEIVPRDSPQPGAVFTRVAASHLRIGTFEYFARAGDEAGVRALTQYAIARHYPEAAHAENPALAFLSGVIQRQADLIASWLHIGFIHGVMNTDNTTISGETIDYGPCAFMDWYDPGMVYSSIDHGGRYAFANQPRIAQWNLARLAEALLPQLAPDVDAARNLALAALDAFALRFEATYFAGLLRKIGITEPQDGDKALAQDLLARMAANQADFTLTFRHLSAAEANPAADAAARAQFTDPAAYESWATTWRARLAADTTAPDARAATMRAVNPARIPRNHIVASVLKSAADDGDFEPFEALLAALAAPYTDTPGLEYYTNPPKPEEIVRLTYCGT